ncbi:MAG: ATP-binding protein [Bacteroidetes bacterium]|nr:ATP-binding protein [Bacteroidota bacterium]
MSPNPVVGSELLPLVTAGMYYNPCVVFREYLQNSADAVTTQGNGSVRIKIDRLNSQVIILDNGIGLSPSDASQYLINVGRSKKDRKVDRGFRGIGRLSALAFAEQIKFSTRTCSTEPVTQVTWNGRLLRESKLAHLDASEAIKRCVTVGQLPDDDWPDRFFEVAIERINRHATSTLLNEDVVRRYIGEVCPVPISNSFPLASQVREFLTAHTDYFVLDVRINDDDVPVQRPFSESLQLSDQYEVAFDRLETHVIPRIDANAPAAIVWLAHSPYAGSIPSRLGIRGLRARVGNIQIGTDRIFEHLFLEPRFNGWCVGEVHILDRRLVPNGRRDYFEPNPHLRNLENHIGAIAHEISLRCRRASSQRNKVRKITNAVDRLKHTLNLATSGYLLPEDVKALIERERKRIPEIKQILDVLSATTPNSAEEELTLLENQLDLIKINSDPKIDDISLNSGIVLQPAFAAIAEILPPDSALEIIETIYRRLSDQP